MRALTLLAGLLMTTLAYCQDNIILRNGAEIPAKVLEVDQTNLKYRKTDNPDGPVYTTPLRDVLLIKYGNGTKDTYGPQNQALATPATTDLMHLPASPTPGSRPAGLGYRRSAFARYYVDPSGQRISLSQAQAVFQNQPDALTALVRGRSLRTWSLVTAIPAVAVIGTGIGLAVLEHGGSDGRNEFIGGADQKDPNDKETGSDRGGRGGNDGFNEVGAVLAGGGVLLGVASIWLNHQASVQFRRAADRYNGRQSTSLQFGPSQRSLGVGLKLTF
ncbi:hypothetical protein [Larkinella sp. C7]|uniref:hypothetical protein n=1 Tax=Larkinella sp. C7 TaxID=2576607 RepID=UPI00111127D4|nr:hypothetical protein [Larkinella sp. C7]